MRSLLLTVSAATVLLTGLAHADVLADRQAIMKDMGKAVGTIGPMIKGAKPFDGAAALAALDKLNEDAAKFDAEALFPVGSDKGDTEASPKIWENKDEFVKHVQKFQADAKEAAAAKPADLDALKPVFQKVAANCGACHEDFRIKKN